MAYSNWANNNNQGSDMGPFQEPQSNATTQQSDVPSFASLAGGGHYWKPEKIGDTIQGVITDWQVEPYHNFGETQQAKSRSGKPKWQFKVTLKTALHDDEDDDGTRTIYLKTWQVMHQLRDALQQAGLNQNETPANGLTMAIRYTHDEKPVQPGFHGAKHLDFKFAKPGAAQPAQQAQPQQQEPAF